MEIFDPVGINNMLTKYRYKEIQLKELLDFFQAKYFYNWVYHECSDLLTTVVTEQEASIYCLLTYRDEFISLLVYPELAEWKRLCHYVMMHFYFDQKYRKCYDRPSRLESILI